MTAKATLIDPVCGMSVDPETSPHTTTHDGVLYTFCAAGCKTAFEESPENFLLNFGAPEIASLERKTIASAVITVAILGVGLMSPERLEVSERMRAVLLFALTTPVFFWCGSSFLRGLTTGLRRLSFNMDSLIAMGSGAAYGYSALATFYPQAFVSVGAAPHLYFDSSAMIITLVLLGKLIESRVKRKASSAIQALVELQPRVARLVIGEAEREIPIERVRVGDVLTVRTGEKVPLDGIIREGHPSIDEAMLTGENFPIDKAPGDEVTGGTLNQMGAFRFEVTSVGEDTTLAGIARVVRQAQGSKLPVQRMADRIASVFVPMVVFVAAVTFLVWLWAGPTPALPFALNNAIGVLIIACPGALGLATPTAIALATARGAQMGILFKSAETLELLPGVTDLVLDKTGTVTEGKLKVTDVLSVADHDTRGLVALAASAEKASEHPAGQAIVAHAHGIGVVVPNPTEYEALPGRGVRARVDGADVLVGNERLLVEYGIDGGRLLTGARHLAAEGKSSLFIVANGERQGIIGIADTVKAGSPGAVARMKAQGLHPVMITGDSASVAGCIGESLGIDQVLGGVMPQHKALEIEKLQSTGRKVAMVGDGINDAPALARADVGIAIGSGTDITMQTSDVTLGKDDLNVVVDAIVLSRATMRIIRQNLFWAFFYNVVGIPLAAGILYPVAGILLSPVVAAGAMALSSVSVVANALRLRT